LLLTLLIFVAATLTFGGLCLLLADMFLRDRTRLNRRMDETFRNRQREQIRRSDLFRDLGPMADELTAGERLGLRERFAVVVEQSALNVTPSRLLLYGACLGAGFALVGWLPRQSVLLGLIAGLLGAAVPFLYVLHKRKARLNRILHQLPDAYDLMGRILRAGQSVSQSMQAVATEFEMPLGGEFAYCYEQQNLGLAPDIALRDLARRTGLLEVKILTLAMVVQQETGGNLAELLDKLATVIRERIKIKGKISALTAEGRMQAVVLLILPIALLLGLMAMSRLYYTAVIEHPNIVVAMLVMEGFGALVIRKIVNFDF
jgi:tight adherence protein B